MQTDFLSIMIVSDLITATCLMHCIRHVADQEAAQKVVQSALHPILSHLLAT